MLFTPAWKISELETCNFIISDFLKFFNMSDSRDLKKNGKSKEKDQAEITFISFLFSIYVNDYDVLERVLRSLSSFEPRRDWDNQLERPARAVNARDLGDQPCAG